MASKKKYSGSFSDYEKKLSTVMSRLGIEKYAYDWSRRDCYVEFACNGRIFKFQHSLDSEYAKENRITFVSDLFAQVVLTLEDLARASERGLYDFSQIISGLPSLPESVAHLEPCFIAMGFSKRPSSEEEVKQYFHRQAMVVHPDGKDGDRDAWETLQRNYKACLEILRKEGGT